MPEPVLNASLMRLGLWPRLALGVLALVPLWAAFWWALR